MLRLAAGTALALVTLSSTNAAAQTSDARAQTLFEAAKQLRDGGQVADACPMFAESQKLSPGVGVTLYLADCYERLGRSASAWQQFRRAESLARERSDDKRAELARARAGALEPKLDRLTILASPEPHEGWHVLVDGAQLPPAMWNTALALDPGEHAVAIEVPGRPPRLVYAQLDASHASASVRIDDGAAAPPPPAAAEPAKPSPASPAPAEPPPPPPHAGSAVRTLVATGLAVVGVVGVGLGVEFLVKRNNLIHDCTPCDTPQNEDDTAAAAAIAFSAGGAALISSLALFLSAPASTPATGSRSGARSGFVWSPTVMPGGAGAVVVGAF